CRRLKKDAIPNTKGVQEKRARDARCTGCEHQPSHSQIRIPKKRTKKSRPKQLVHTRAKSIQCESVPLPPLTLLRPFGGSTVEEHIGAETEFSNGHGRSDDSDMTGEPDSVDPEWFPPEDIEEEDDDIGKVKRPYGAEKILLKEGAVPDTTDGHLQTEKRLRDNKPKLTHYLDVWHVAQNLQKKCALVAEWMRSILYHLYWCAATSEGDADMLEARWKSMCNHIANIHVHENPLLQVAALHFNENGGRDQAKGKHGVLQFNIAYPKYKKKDGSSLES
ncbi:hypothetical protein KUCAC02_037498, partial [Chaenocephalus aceratus]